MKSIYSWPGRALATFVLINSLNTPGKAQTTLATGDLAFSGYKCNDAVPDQFSFVLLKAITAGTVIKFSDYGWRPTENQLTNNGFVESEMTFTAGSAIPAGREITFVATSAVATFTNGTTAGTMVYSVGASFLVGNLTLSNNGDQLFAYQGTFPTPTTFIAGIHMNVYTGVPSTTTAAAWDGDLTSLTQDNTNSGKPAALTTGVNANWFNVEQDNVKFLCGTFLYTAELVRAALNSANTYPSNWQANNTNPSGFTLPSNCVYMGLYLLPVSIESFTGKLNSDKTVTLQWKVAAQQDIQEYIVEESADGITYWQSGTVAAGNGTVANYSYTDMQVATGNNYYRLKTVELSGKISYSDVVVVNLKAGIKVNVYPNPVTDKLTIQQFGTIQNKTAVLSDGRGNILQQIKLSSLQQQVNMETYPAGVYIVKMEDGTVFKVVKQ
jgi:hypothetical protein